jgi:hypothetical protein
LVTRAVAKDNPTNAEQDTQIPKPSARNQKERKAQNRPAQSRH